ncbi:MAG TPA: hypothetical protein IAC34_04595 [Candidatus Coprenecus stercoripullorum]|nr:hypothetical protein [Candidatus Coprenecus stercoripullorum]
MNGRFAVKVTAILLAFPLASCQLYDRIFNDEVVARIGNEVLYRKDTDKIVGHGLSPEDSARIVSQYINLWAKNRLLLNLAENNLSKADRNVDAYLEEYRQQLLIYRYQKQYVEERIDTVVGESECRAFYDANPHSFLAQVSLVKGIFVKISNDSPNLPMIMSLYKSIDPDDREELERLCYTSAENYYLFDDWVGLDVIARELGTELSECEEVLSSSHYMRKESLGYTYLLAIDDRVPKGELAPFDYSQDKIRDMIISRRKQDMISTLERNLLDEAVTSDKLKIYSK